MQKRSKILVVDDDHSTLEILLLILQNAGYTVEVANNGNHTLLIDGTYPDLIILDNNLGGKNGSDICKELKAGEHTQHIPVILISAMDNLKTIAMDACADDHILKPFSMQLLLEKISTALTGKNDPL